MKQKTVALGLTIAAGLSFTGQARCAADRPNVILIMSDDQGYGDVRAHGHPFIRTPNMDKLHAESVRFTDFHVAPMCTPTRGQLLTGVDAMKNGATAVCQGRSMIRREIPTLANYFSEAGYRTIISGKWHLGDSYPHRPQDRGFQEVLSFRAWGLPSLASHWANSFINPDEPTDSYHDPVLEHNGKDERYPGYVTDIFFDHAMSQIEACSKAKQPFFLYLPTPTPHTPNISPKEKLPYYRELNTYEGKKVHAEYYGMIENIDDNLGRLEQFLVDQGLKDNTILVYLSDNGTQSHLAMEMYNAGMRDKKTSVYEGGHRVPLFVRWPAGGLKHGRDVSTLSQVQDLCPTLLELCEIKPRNLYAQSGRDLSPLLKGEAWPHDDRLLVVQYRTGGELWNSAVAMQGPWRLIGKKLYNIESDPHQDRDVASQFPERADTMERAYQDWHQDAYKQFLKTRYIDLGHPEVPSTTLYASDWDGDYCDNPGGLQSSTAKGAWHVEVVQAGRYRIELSRWPFESGKTLTEATDPKRAPARGARPIAAAKLQIAGRDYRLEAEPDARQVTFNVELDAGKTQLQTTFLDAEDRALCSANYTRVTHLAVAEGELTPVSARKPPDAKDSRGFVPSPKADVTLKDEWSTFPLYDQVGYDQPLRPQFHFTSRMGWLNDPNGMVYYDGEWHMYFQHFAKGNASGAKSWGSAVSPDLVHWTQLRHAINPYPKIDGSDGLHAIWSGSAVVDVLNALGKQKGDTKTLFALYSATHAKFFQGGAYSTDKGRTWTKIDGGKPVIPHQEGFSKGQRDPRIFYYAPGKCYYTIMMIGGPERKVRLWKSSNLLDWEHAFDIPNKAAECIDMYTVAVDGDPNNMLWVIADAGTHYEVGDFDGEAWTGLGDKDKDGKPLRFDFGDSYYAAQVFNQAPGGRVVHIGWLRSKATGYRPFLEADMPFTQQMSIPAEITLRTTPDGIRMFRNPVTEIETLYVDTLELGDLDVAKANEKLKSFQPELVDLTLRCAAAKDFMLSVRGLEIRYDAAAGEVVFNNTARVDGEKAGMAQLPKDRQRPYRDNGVRRIPAPPVDGNVTLRVLVDRASLEIFVNDGAAAGSFVVVPQADNRRIVIEGNDTLRIQRMVVNEVRSIWK